MKAALLLILFVAGCFAATALTLRALGVAVPMSDPINAGALAVVAGILGILPLTLSRQCDPVTLMPRALMGTVLHMLVATCLAITLIALHSVDQRRQLIFWVSGGYLISLLAVVWQSQRILSMAAPVARDNLLNTKASEGSIRPH